MSCVLNGVAQHCTLLCPPASKQKKKKKLPMVTSNELLFFSVFVVYIYIYIYIISNQGDVGSNPAQGTKSFSSDENVIQRVVRPWSPLNSIYIYIYIVGYSSLV